MIIFRVANSLPKTRYRPLAHSIRMSSKTVFDQNDFDAASYSNYRITYPRQIFQTIHEFHKSSPHAEFSLALDVATGTGQASSELAHDFDRVIGTDSSQTMLKSAISKPNIEYMVSTAESFPSVIGDESVDLITVMEAAHWFDMDLFYNECFRVLKGSGSLAILGYGVSTVPDPVLSEMIRAYAIDFLEPYWDSRRHRLDRYYTDPEFTNDKFIMDRRMYHSDTSCLKKTLSLHSFGLYLKTWSAYKTFKEKSLTAVDPVDDLISRMLRHMNGSSAQSVTFEFTWPYVLLLQKKKQVP